MALVKGGNAVQAAGSKLRDLGKEIHPSTTASTPAGTSPVPSLKEEEEAPGQSAPAPGQPPSGSGSAAGAQFGSRGSGGAGDEGGRSEVDRTGASGRSKL